jgi:sugar phosphate isomerase/epimerase
MPSRTASFPIGFRRGGSDWQKDLNKLASWTKESGFEAIDLTGATTAGDVKTITDHGLRVGTVDLLDFGNICNTDAGKRKEVLEKNLAHIKSVAAIGAKIFFTCALPGDNAKSRKDNYKEIVDCYSPLAQAAASSGATIVLEGWPGGAPYFATLCCTPETCRSILKDIPRGISLNYDPSHLIRLGVDHYRFLQEFLPHVQHVHAKDTEIFPEAIYEMGLYQDSAFKDPHRWGAQVWRYTIPGHGETRWPAVFALLKSANFTGVVSVELEDENFNPFGEKGEKEGLLHSLAFLKGA